LISTYSDDPFPSFVLEDGLYSGSRALLNSSSIESLYPLLIALSISHYILLILKVAYPPSTSIFLVFMA